MHRGKIGGGYSGFIIFPYGDVGMQVKRVLNEAYGIQEAYILDNRLCKYNSQIKSLSFLNGTDCHNYCLILASTDPQIYDELKDGENRKTGTGNYRQGR